MDFKVFDTRKIDEYSKRAKEQWGQTSEYKEFEEKTKNWTKDDEATVANEFMQLFVEFGQMKEMDPEDEQVQLQVRKLQDYITDHFYTCSDKILCGLGRMYAGGGELTENIDDVINFSTHKSTLLFEGVYRRKTSTSTERITGIYLPLI